MAHEKNDVFSMFKEAVDDVKKIYEVDNVSKENSLFWEALSKRVSEIKDDVATYYSTSRRRSLDPPHYQKQNSVAKGNFDPPLPRQSSLQEPPKMISDAGLMQTVTLFFRNDLFNLLEDVPKDVDNHVLLHVQKVTMAMHKQACDKLWDLVRHQLESSNAVWSILLKEFLPSIQLNEKQTNANIMRAFQDWFQQIYCSGTESHPPSDKRPLERTMEAVMKVQHEALERLNLDCTILHAKISTELEADCLKRLEGNKLLKMHVKPNNLLRLACKICQVVSAMLLHSSPIIPFTELGTFFSTYHEPTHDAKEDPNGRSVLVYRTPYLYFYHYGELKTLLKASITFVIHSCKFSAPLPIFGRQKLCDEVKDLFKRDPNSDCRLANKKTDYFVEWYHSANETLTKAMQKRKLLTSQDYHLLCPPNVKADSTCSSDVLKAFKKRHHHLVEESTLLTSIGLENKLTEGIRASGVLNQEEKDQAAQLIVAFLCSPDLWVPFGVKDAPSYMPSTLHTTAGHPQQQQEKAMHGRRCQIKQPPQQIQYYFEPLLVNFTHKKNAVLSWVEVTLK